MDVILNVLSYVFWVALALGILVFVHELGHFLTARLFGMRVDAFSIGFPPVIARKQIGDTEYRLGAVPLGGYVKIAGMIDESLDTDGLREPVLDEHGEPVLDRKGEPAYRLVESEPQPDEYRSKPVWQRMIVISGGVIFNLILAVLIFVGLALWYGEAYIPAENVEGIHVADASLAYDMGLRTGDRVVAVNGEPIDRFEAMFAPEALASDPYRVTVERDGRTLTVDGPDRLISRLSRMDADDTFAAFGVSLDPAAIGDVVAGAPAAEAGLRAGDRIVAIDGEPVQFWAQMAEAIQASEGQPLAVRWARPDSLVEASDPEPVGRLGDAALYEAPVTPRASEDGSSYQLGVYALPLPLAVGVEYRRYGFVEGIGAGAQMAWENVRFYVQFIGRLVTGRESVRDSVGGPLMIAKQTKEAADAGGQRFWLIVAVLSIALAVFNILPIPVLDGGHLVFLLYEAITRREPSLKVRLVVQQVGLAVLLLFMVFVIFNDAVRWFG